jgi:hypothetical protein
MFKPHRTIMAISIGALTPSFGFAASLNVPSGPYPTIQTAIDAAASQDEILVAPGTYAEKINLNGKAIKVIGSGGPDVTILDGTGLGDSVVTVENGEGPGTAIQGFTITGGNTNLGAGMIVVNSGPAVIGCIFTENTASNCGGGIFNQNSNPTIVNCVFTLNTATTSGGGVCNENATPTITNCAFIDNTANVGGGIHNSTGSNAGITNCTLTQNTGNSGGGGMWNNNASVPVVTNCILWDNTGGSFGGPNTPAVVFSNVQGGFSGPGNINADPLFVTGPLGDIYLSQVAAGQGIDSPCLDAGAGIAVELFISGTTRDDTVDDAAALDMGYHYVAELRPRADVDGDGDVDGVDFSTFASCFNKAGNFPRTAGCPVLSSVRLDFDHDRDIDGVDFGVFATCYNKAGNPPRTPCGF